jgi:hypothetical protein
MAEICIQLTEDEFDERYALVVNPFNPHASWGFGDNEGCLFETYGEELDFVRRQDPQCVWTFVDGDNGDLYVISGFHWVNRIGYLVSREPVPMGTVVEVHIPMDFVEPDDDDGNGDDGGDADGADDVGAERGAGGGDGVAG